MIDLDALATGVAQSLLRPTQARADNLQHIVQDAFRRGYVLGATIRPASATQQRDGAPHRVARAGRAAPMTEPPCWVEAAIAQCYGRLAEIEACIEQACERSATRRLDQRRCANRACWPRAAWRCFVMQAECELARRRPEMLRLRREVTDLERLAAHPPAK